MSVININNAQKPPIYTESTPKSISGLPPLIWQRVALFFPPTECARNIHPLCNPLKDIMLCEGTLDLSGKSITGKDLVRIIKACQAETIEIVNVSGCTDLTDDDLTCLAALPLKHLYLKGCTKITDKGLSYLKTLPLETLDLNGCTGLALEGLEHLLLHTQMTELTLPSSKMEEDLLNQAVLKENAKLLKKILSIGIKPEFPETILRGFPTPLYFATSNGDKECVELLLQAGADPNIEYQDEESGESLTPYQLAMESKDASFISLYSVHSSPQLRVFSPYVSKEFRTRAVKSFLNPLFKPSRSVKAFIEPLQAFATKETQRDPDFAVYIIPQDNPFHAGSYSHVDGTIDLYVKYQKKPERITSPLLHELSHKVVDKLGWTGTKKAEYMAEVAKDIEVLKADNWEHCDPAIKSLFQAVDHYAPEKQFEEYLVRMPEIVTLMAKKPSKAHRSYLQNRLMGMKNKPSRQSIETRLQEEIPHLYAIYTGKFLPDLEQYNYSP